jgi:hypothetical protein
MENINQMLAKYIDEYEKWLQETGIPLKNFDERKVTKNQCGIRLRAFRRHRKNWKLTKIQEKTIQELKIKEVK